MEHASVDAFARLYVVPGMGHCGGGTESDPTDIGERLRHGQDAAHSVIRALERWVEIGAAPFEIVATKYQVEDDPASGIVRTRPICPYPSVARWDGRGNQDDAAAYSCEPPTR
jgi:feruloyl esterase